MESVRKEVIIGQLEAFAIKFNKKAGKKALGSLVTHELKIRLNERNVKLNGKENIHDLITLWAKFQGTKPIVAKSDVINIDLSDKKDEPKVEAEPKDEDKAEAEKAMADLVEAFKKQCDSFGLRDITDVGCTGADGSCDKTKAELYKACDAYTEQLKADKKKASGDKKKRTAGAGTTIFGHQKGAISGKIDDALISADGPYTLAEIGKLAECTVARVKNHINKDLKVGLRVGGATIDINEKDGKFSASVPKKEAKAA